MTERLTVELPLDLAQRLRALAAQSRRPVEELLVECIDRVVSEPPIEALADDDLLSLCDTPMKEEQQAELSDLLAANREGKLGAVERQRLNELMRVYRGGLIRKALALRTAVARGLRPRLN